MITKYHLRSTGRCILALALLVFSRSANAEPQDETSIGEETIDEKRACIKTFEQAQIDRKGGRLLAAQQLLLECSRPACGSLLASECTQMYSDVERALPSVVLSARDEASAVDLTAVEVTLNGHPFATSLNGKPIPIDPGAYEFVFSAAGHAPLTRRAVIGTGEKYRAINVVFPNPNALAVPREHDISPSVTDPSRGVPAMTWVFGGVGLVGLGTGVVLRLIANNDFDAMKEGCAARGCPASDIDMLGQKYLISNIAFGVGAAATAGAVLWYVLARETAESATLTVLPMPDGRGAWATAQGRF